MNILDQITMDYKKDDIPEFKVGDTLRVHVKIIEGQRERIQVFEGYVLKRQHGGVNGEDIPAALAKDREDRGSQKRQSQKS